jgi:hypothetical protein
MTMARQAIKNGFWVNEVCNAAALVAIVVSNPTWAADKDRRYSVSGKRSCTYPKRNQWPALI